jgi:uncharacterized damage-inducible protein DinB
MHTNTFGQEFLRELESEIAASRKCLERIDPKYFEYKPHEKSMKMGYLALMVADIPKWIAVTVEKGDIDLATWGQYTFTTTEDLVAHFDKNIEAAKQVLSSTSDETLEEMFYLRMSEKELMKSSRKDSVSSSLNHWVHHRGQLSVYMRLNDIPVPSLYGPSADEQTF